jgi:hypothetical protein
MKKATPLIKFWNLWDYDWQNKRYRLGYKATDTLRLLRDQSRHRPKGKGNRAWKRAEALDKGTHWICGSIGVQ